AARTPRAAARRPAARRSLAPLDLAPLGLGERAQSRLVEAKLQPIRDGVLGALPAVEVDRELVPVEHVPVHAVASALERQAGHLAKQRPARPGPSRGRLDVELLEPEARAQPGARVARVEQAIADGPARPH